MDNYYYDLLGLERNADAKAIKKAFRKLAIKHHPDRGGNEATFKKISEAYEVLSHGEKKEIYDQHGRAGLSSEEKQHRSCRRSNSKGKTVTTNIKCTLEDMYCGKIKTIKVTRKRMQLPTGTTKENAFLSCKTCRGQGSVVQMRRTMLGNIPMESKCFSCQGSGKISAPGVHFVSEAKNLELHIDKGSKTGCKQKFREESDEQIGIPENGDLVVVLQQIPHKTFERKNADLLMKKKITLLDALAGLTFEFTHLDGRIVSVTTEPNKIIKPNEVMVINNEGMPVLGNPFVKGKLYVQFDIIFPEAKFSIDQKKQLKNILSPDGIELKQKKNLSIDTTKEENIDFKTNEDDDENVEKVLLEDFLDGSSQTLEVAFGTSNSHGQANNGKDAYESDDEDERHHQGGAQCAHQ
jgi:DnaJ family protein A protein 2